MPQKPIIIHMITGLDIGGVDGGREIYGIEIVRHLNLRKVNAVLCVFWRRGTPIEQEWIQSLKRDGIPFFFAAERKEKFSFTEFSRGVHQLEDFCANQKCPVILHSHYQIGTVAGIGLRLQRRIRLLVRTVHINNREWNNDRGGWLPRLLLTDLLFPLICDAEVGVSQAGLANLQHRIVRRIFERPCALLYNGLSPDRIRALMDHSTQPASVICQSDKIIIGCVGRLSEQKDYRTLIAAMPYVLKKIPTAHLLLVGDGQLREDLLKQAKALDIHEKVIFAGQQKDIDPYLFSMNIFVLPSLWEGLPTVLLESMSAGIPVIASDIPGNRDLVEDGVTGWLAPPADPLALAKVIISAINNEEGRVSVVKQARQRAASFSMDVIASGHLALYRQLCPQLFSEDTTDDRE